jgi:hypothetical protein
MSTFATVSVAVVVLLLGAVSPAAASSIGCDDSFLLSTLLTGGSVTVGDKLFDQFGYVSTGDMPDASGVNVLPFVDDNGNFGLRFQGGFLDVFDGGAADPGSPSDALISYRVTVLDPAFLISDVNLAGNPAVHGPSGLIGVTETFLLDDPFVELSIFALEPGGLQQLVDGSLLTTPLKSLHVQKNIIAFADVEGSAATLSFIDQTFSQVAVPEPSTISLLLLGLGAMAWRIRRRTT